MFVNVYWWLWTSGWFGLALLASPLLSIYFLPTLKGLFRPSVDLRRVAVVNLLLGWTVWGWLVAVLIAEGAIPSRSDARLFG